MKGKLFITGGLALLLGLIASNVFGGELINREKKADIVYPLRIGESLYFIDKYLIDNGFSLINDGHKIILLYNNVPVHNPEIEQKFVGPDKFRKLFITLQNSLKKFEISLCGKDLRFKTDNSGYAPIDMLAKDGFCTLKLSDKKRALNFLFRVDGDTRLICRGTDHFKCDHIGF